MIYSHDIILFYDPLLGGVDLFKRSAEKLVFMTVMPGLPVSPGGVEEKLRLNYMKKGLLWEGSGDSKKLIFSCFINLFIVDTGRCFCVEQWN